MRMVSPGFIDEFHAMFAMYMNNVSILYGSPAQALAITMCIMPCAASGASQVNALSMRIAVPSSSNSRSCGPCGKPSAIPGIIVFGLLPLPTGAPAGGFGFG